MDAKTQEEIMADPEETYWCPGSKDCGITKCQHFGLHAMADEGCDNRCFPGSGCISLREARRKGGQIS